VSERLLALGVDIGATKLAAALVDGDGRLLWRSQTPTPRSPDPEVVWTALAELVAAAPSGASLCGVGCAAPLDSVAGTVSPLNIPAWRAFPLASRLAGVTSVPTWVESDAKALALGEGVFGAAVGRRGFLSMVVSSGVGGGIVLDGRLLGGDAGNAGHIGHLIVEPGGRECACGARGCLEAEASGMSIEAVTARPAAEAGPETIERVGTLVGRAVAGVANLLDLTLATVAGSVALGYGDPFFESAQAELDRSCRLAFSRGTRIVASGLGADGPLVGAATVGWWHAGLVSLAGGGSS
jgi:glucokinase